MTDYTYQLRKDIDAIYRRLNSIENKLEKFDDYYPKDYINEELNDIVTRLEALENDTE